ncbi:hypothetical protein EV401DRAFT_1893061 [Pisolithus croceorrhizus]|nr:hypothetical protein EV401DRAFT_1893061 [Pisolithus croceorrhizus]
MEGVVLATLPIETAEMIVASPTRRVHCTGSPPPPEIRDPCKWYMYDNRELWLLAGPVRRISGAGNMEGPPRRSSVSHLGSGVQNIAANSPNPAARRAEKHFLQSHKRPCGISGYFLHVAEGKSSVAEVASEWRCNELEMILFDNERLLVIRFAGEHEGQARMMYRDHGPGKVSCLWNICSAHAQPKVNGKTRKVVWKTRRKWSNFGAEFVIEKDDYRRRQLRNA